MEDGPSPAWLWSATPVGRSRPISTFTSRMARGYPYVIDSFALAGEADPAMLMKVLAGEDAFPHGGALKPETRGRQLPLNFNIVDFAKAR